MIWQKFHPLYGAALKVSFENTFLPETVFGLDLRYQENHLIYVDDFTKKVKVYEPSLETIGDNKNSEAVQVIFEPLQYLQPLWRHLQFTRGNSWIIAARLGEEKVFGFDAEINPQRKRYMRIAYPGRSSQFIPVYFKIQEKDASDFIYLEVWAWDKDKEVIIQARRVAEYEAPDHLILAGPAAKVVA